MIYKKVIDSITIIELNQRSLEERYAEMQPWSTYTMRKRYPGFKMQRSARDRSLSCLFDYAGQASARHKNLISDKFFTFNRSDKNIK